MNVNGSRHHLLLGQDDWGRCHAVVDGMRLPQPLAVQWALQAPPATVPAWDVVRDRLTLAQLDADLPATPGEQAFTAADRRAGSADAAGNLYVIARDRAGIEVLSRGDGRQSAFWPALPGRRGPPSGSFTDAEPQPAFAGPLASLAITDENWLVAAARGRLARFDLVGGGGPEVHALPPELGTLLPTDLAPAPCGGLWLLDGPGGRLFRIDRHLGFERAAPQGAEAAVFQPLAPAPRREVAGRALRPIAIPGAGDPLALAALPGGSVAVLVAMAGGLRLLLADCDGAVRELAVLPYRAFCIAVLPRDGGVQVLLADVDGNQVHSLALTGEGAAMTVRIDPTAIPMRRFGGRGLIPAGDYVYYDSGADNPLWVPLLPQRRQFFARENALVTPRFDSGEPQCTWDRIRIDGRIPPGTSVRIEARASDDPALIGSAAETGWIVQPQPYLNSDGGELPGKRALAMLATDRQAGTGTWDLLLQGVTGRYVELRIALHGDGRFTPSLRALRLWYPRFSWSERFLPGAWREDAVSASFIERFLANMEGIGSGIEGRIAAAQVLFDTEAAPAEAIEWLAGWYDMALDPRWSERQKRLFVHHAPVFFNWRGTVRGLRLALRIATGVPVTDADFALAAPPPPDPRGVRVVESFSGRGRWRRWAPSDADDTGGGLPGSNLAALWSPHEGAVGLARRWALARDPLASPSDPVEPFLDLDPGAHPEVEWASFCRSQLGFVPEAGGAERRRWLAYLASAGGGNGISSLPTEQPVGTLAERWQAFTATPARTRIQWVRFLTERHRRVERLNLAWGTGWASIGEVPIPDVLPQNPQALQDWLAFEGQVLAMDRTAHRFSVLLPRTTTGSDFAAEQDLLAVAQRIVGIEKPAHTVFDVRFYWAMNRLGEARLSLDTQIGEGSRAPELVPAAVVGRAWLGASFTGGPGEPGSGRSRIPVPAVQHHHATKGEADHGLL